MFVSEYLCQELAKGTPRQIAMCNASKEWKKIKHQGKDETYVNKAKEIILRSPETMTESQKNLAITRIVKDIEAKIEELGKLGGEGLAVIFVPASGKLLKTGTTEAIKYLETSDIDVKFSKFTSDDHPTCVKDKKKLKKEVQQLFNERFFSATGRPCVPYQEIRQGRWEISGLPDGVIFKKPSSYGIATLTAILEKPNITFTECTNREKSDDENDANNVNAREDKENEADTENDESDGEENEPEIQVTDLEQLCEIVGVDETVSDVYTVEEIRKKRRRKGKTEYLVKWEGYEECTWEPYNNIPYSLRMSKLKKKFKKKWFARDYKKKILFFNSF
ncbi:uncharacterized protein LOC117112036 isoform X3 [Anneissia japonica]|uniref:uncharacterized protein LOC117112036 isoform X3 n=1 Tax=Anneissia japonica TaxID=1529436 RepID=UPI0014259B93|nr:uncharacterized protein LOC117112036 isoform X3 [Anneissia japonica]